MKPIIKWTLLQRRASTIWWSIGAFGLIFINMIFYPSFKDQAAELQKSFENLPDAAVQFIGGSTDFFSPVGFLNSQIYFLMLPLLLGILAIGLGASLIGKEEQDKTIETILARPISRDRLLLSKAIAGIMILTVATIVSFITVFFTKYAVDLEISNGTIVAVTFVCWLLETSFVAIAYTVASSGRARGASIGIATVFALGGYLVSSLAGTVKWLEWPSKILPFHYYQPEAILKSTYNWQNLWYFVGILVICTLLSRMLFRKRDLS